MSPQDAPSKAAEQQSILVRLTRLAMPIVGLNVLNVLALAIDTAMCGRVPGAEAVLTGLGFATQIVFLLMVMMMGLLVGSVALVARAHGAGDTDRVEHLLLQSTQLTVVLGVVVAVLGNIAARPLLQLLGAEGDALTAALAYLRPLLFATVFYYLSLLYAAVLRGVGNTRIAFQVALAATAINVALNYGLILGNYGLPALGVRGAAYGTVASQVFTVFALVAVLRSGAVPTLRVSFRPRPVDRALAKELARVGAPAALDLLILNGSFMSILGMLGRIDPVAVAAHGIGLRVQSLAFVPGLGVSQACAAMVGQALGAEDVARARRVVLSAVALCVLIMTGLAIPIVLGAHPLVAVFDVPPGTALEAFSVEWIRILGFGMPVVGAQIALVGMLRGSGDTRVALTINAVASVLQIPASYALGFPLGWGAFGVWVAFPASYVLRLALAAWVFQRGRWAKVGLRVS
ncbi:MAG: MATE family efflux transporter [Sandaracinaceae bacterium]